MRRRDFDTEETEGTEKKRGFLTPRTPFGMTERKKGPKMAA
jgi:hypothetical protein